MHWLQTFQDSIIVFFHPQLENRVPNDIPTITWPLSKAGPFLTILGLYLVWVAYGWFRKMNALTSSTRTSAGSGGGGRHLSGGGRRRTLSRDPLLSLQTVYNFGQVVLCTKVCHDTWKVMRDEEYSFYGNSFDPRGRGLAPVLWLFYVSKAIDFIDTILIVIRQKWRQLSFVHCYHHACTFIVFWISNLTAYDSDIYLCVLLNSFVHVIMYAYYFMCSIGCSVPKGCKQAITTLQLLQFGIMQVQGVVMVLFGTPFPLRVSFLYLGYVATLIPLFLNFANRTYTTKDNDSIPARPSSQVSKSAKGGVNKGMSKRHQH